MAPIRLHKTAIGILAVLLLTNACGPTVTRTAYVETDTYISSADSTNHSEQNQIRVSNANGIEERTLLKLPTGERDPSKSMEDIFGSMDNPLLWPLLPFVVVFDIFASFFNCADPMFSATNLVSSYLFLDVADNSGSASLAGISLQHVTKPWWQTVNWSQAFPFSSAGNWEQGGGDLDASFTPIPAVDMADGTIRFDVTAYFKTLIADQTLPHYGFVMRSSSGAALSQVLLKSVQSSDYYKRPRLTSTYTCTTPATTSMLQARETSAAQPKPYTFVLGPRQ